MDPIMILVIALLLAIIGLMIYLRNGGNKDGDGVALLQAGLNRLEESSRQEFRANREELGRIARENRDELNKTLREFRDEQRKGLVELKAEQKEFAERTVLPN